MKLPLAAALVLASLGGCSSCERRDESSEGALPPWGTTPTPQRPPNGMVWIEPGVLIAGTPADQLPRVADAELPGKRVELGGFFIDRFNYPGEPGAIPQAGMTQADARALCHREGKRLCTELEWERACKGPDNRRYGDGDDYDAARCATGGSDALSPNGSNERCVSPFGVHDMHGGPWNWTASSWGRGDASGLVAVRGGDGGEGELVARCAHGRGLEPTTRDPLVGVRCCAGAPNAAVVDLTVRRGPRLSHLPPDDPLAERLTRLAPTELVQHVARLPSSARFTVERLWIWRPVGNEELVLGGGCARLPVHAACGVVVARVAEKDAVAVVAFVSSDWWIGAVGEQDAPERALFIYGGDLGGAYRKTLVYRWGRVEEGGKMRKKGGGWALTVP